MDIESQVAVLDYGSQYTQLIVRRVREMGWFAKLYLPNELDLAALSAKAVILSGGPRSVLEPDAPDIDLEMLLGLEVPVLGVCYGMQLLTKKLGGDVAPSEHREYGPAALHPKDEHGGLFDGISAESEVWMSHSDTVKTLPMGARVIASNQHDTPVALQFSDRVFGIQFHPEVTHSSEGKQILQNFLSLIDGEPRFHMESFREELVRKIREEVGSREVVCGVSGGIDSTVLAVLLSEAGVPLRALYVDNGFMRKNETAEVVSQFQTLGIQIEVVDASERFLAEVTGVSDPEEKRRRIGKLFVDVFFEAAENVELLAQGTLYPDVIESATGHSGKNASTIKTHHNRVQQILDLQKEGKVIEPLAELFKDEVRELGRILGIPEQILGRQPFPGPGLAVRVLGEITPEKLHIVREADAILLRNLRETGWYDKIWQAYCALLPVRTVGVKGDERSYEFPITIRAVVSEDAMTADWVALPWELLRKISNEILNTVAGVNRVFYDVSTKPPASIELE